MAGVTISLTADASGVTQETAKVTANLSAAFSGIQAQMKAMETASGSATSKMITGLQGLAQQATRQTVEQGNLSKAFLQTGQAAQTQVNQFEKLRQQYLKTQESTKGVQSSIGGLVTSFKGLAAAAGIAFSVQGIIDLTKSIVEAGIANERLMLSLKGALGSAQAAGEAYAFVEQVANRLGIGLQTAVESFAKLSAATQGTVVQGQQTRDLFIAISEASRVMGLTTAETGGVVTALTQIIGKNTVSMEELRQQLGERLPQALRLVSKEMGVSTATFVDMVSKGQVLAQDFIPAMTRALQQMGKEAPAAAQSVQAALERVGNAWLTLKVTIAQSGLLELVARIAEEMAGVINRTTAWLNRTRRMAGELGLAPMREELARLDEQILKLQEHTTEQAEFGFLSARQLEGLKAQRQAIQDRLTVQQKAFDLDQKVRDADEAQAKAVVDRQAAEDKKVATLKDLSKTYTGLEDSLKGVRTQLDALRSFDVPSLQAMQIDPFGPDFERRFKERETALLKEEQDLLDKRAGLNKGAAARAVQEAGQSAVEMAKAREDALATSLKREEAMIKQSADEQRRLVDEAASAALAAQGPSAVEAIAAKRLQDLRKITVEEARLNEDARMTNLTQDAKFRELRLQAEIAGAGKNLSAATKAQEELNNLAADTEAERVKIRAQTENTLQGISKKSVDDQITQARELNKIIKETEQDRLKARIDLVDEQINLIKAQVDGEILTVEEGNKQIQALEDQRFANVRVLYEQQAQGEIDAINAVVLKTKEGTDERIAAEVFATEQIKKVREGLTAQLQSVNLQQQTQTQEHQNDLLKGWRAWVKDVKSALGDFLFRWMDGQVHSMKDVLNDLKSYFFRIIADMIAYAATKQIIGPILGMILGGAGGAAGLTGTGGTGGGGLLNTAGTALSGLGLAKQLFSFLGIDPLTNYISTGLSTLKETLGLGLKELFQSASAQASQAAIENATAASELGFETTGQVGTGAAGVSTTATVMGIGGGLVAIGAGIYGALNASNNAAKAAYAASSAAGAAAAGIAAYAAIADVAVPTLAGLSATGIGLIAAAVLAVMAVVLDRVIKPAGPNLAVGQPAGLGVGVEGGKLVMTGQATSNVIRQEGVTAAQTGAVQTALNEGITRAVGTIIQTINAVALDPTKLVGPTQDALTKALADIQTINSASAKHMEQDIAEQLKFANIAIIGGMLDPINLAFEQLTDSDLKTQLERLPVTTIGLVDLFKTMNSQLDEMAKGENRDVLGQIQGVREQLDRFGARLARTAGDTAEQIVNGVIQQFDDAIERTQPLKLVSDFSHNLSTLITTFNERMTDGLTALVTLQKTQKTLEDAGLSGAEVGSQVDRLTADLAQQGEIFSTRLVSDALKNLATELDQVVIQPIRIQATTVDSLFTDSLAALNSLWLEWHRLADVGIDTTRMQEQFQKILEGVLSSSADLLRKTLQRGTFPEFLDVLLSIPDALAKLNPVFERLKALGQAFASVVGPIQQAISQGEESLRTPTERVNQTAQQMRELEAAIRDAGTSAEQALPLYAQLAAVIQANAAAQIAAVQQVGAVIEQITTMLDARLTTSQRLARVNQQLTDLQAGRRPGEGVSTLAPWLPTAAGAPMPGRESIDVLSELVTLYGQQLELMGQLVDAIHTGLDSISETLRADEPLIDRVMRLVAAATPRQDIAGIAREQTPEALLRQAAALQEAIGAVRELIGVIAQGLAQIDETLRANETQTERAIRLVATVPSATGVTDPAALIAIAGQIGEALTAVRAVMDLVQGGIESIDSTLFDLLSVADQSANVQAKILALNEEIAASSGATPEQLITLTGLTQRALTLQQQLTRTLEATLEDLRASVEGTGRPSETIADTRSQIAALQQLVDTGAATPEQLQQLVDVNQQLLDLGKQFDLLDVQQEALDSLKALAPMIQAQIDASQAREQALVDNLEAIRGQLAGYLAVATSTEAQLIVQLTDIRAWLEGLLSQAKSTEAQLVAQLAGVQFILQAQLERLHNEALLTEDLLRQQLNQLNQQLLAQYGTTNIQDIVRRIQEQALDELRTLNARLKDLFLAQPDAQALFGIQTTLDGQSGQMDRQTQHLSSLVDQTNTVINKLDDLYASLNRPLRTTPAQSGGWLYASLNRAATGPLGYARGGMVHAILEPGETVFPPPFTSSQTHALMAMNTSFPRMGGGWTVPGSGAGDHVPAMLPSGSFVLNRRASGARGYQDGGSVQGSVSTNHVTINIQVYQQPGQSGRELVQEITRQLRREFRTKNDDSPFK